jgi:hypothetical protein
MQMLAKSHVRPEVPKAINILYVAFWVTASYGLVVDQQAVVLYSKDGSSRYFRNQLWDDKML